MVNWFNHLYPYTDVHELNLDWVIEQIKDMNTNLEEMEARIMEATKKYANELVDEKMASYMAEIEEIEQNLIQLGNTLQTEFDALRGSVNVSLHQMEIRIDDLNDRLTAEIQAVNQRTDLAIEQNNEYLLAHMETELANIKVNNALTGTLYTVQNMFNYLCQLHMTDAITYTDLAAANNTYTELAGYYMTYTQLAMQGNLIIQPNT